MEKRKTIHTLALSFNNLIKDVMAVLTILFETSLKGNLSFYSRCLTVDVEVLDLAVEKMLPDSGVRGCSSTHVLTIHSF